MNTEIYWNIFYLLGISVLLEIYLQSLLRLGSLFFSKSLLKKCMTAENLSKMWLFESQVNWKKVTVRKKL